jgi:hypothetical protein
MLRQFPILKLKDKLAKTRYERQQERKADLGERYGVSIAKFSYAMTIPWVSVKKLTQTYFHEFCALSCITGSPENP